MRILLVDDSAAYYEEFSQLLKDSGISYSALDYASTAEEGARLMGCDAHDMYFIDYRLPALDGMALVRQARSGGLTKPVIVLTAYDSPAVDGAAEQAGANDYLPKGEFSAAMLGRAIRYARQQRRGGASGQGGGGPLSSWPRRPPNIGTWDWDVRDRTRSSGRRGMFAIFAVDPATSPEELYGVWLRAVHHDDRDIAQAAALAALAGQAPLNSLYRILRPDLSRPEAPAAIRWISCKGEAVRDANGRPIRMIGINVDVTEQQNGIAALRASRNQAVVGMQISETPLSDLFRKRARLACSMCGGTGRALCLRNGQSGRACYRLA